MSDLSFYAAGVLELVREVCYTYQTPAVLFKPRVMLDGNQWCALYGENLHEGVAGFGDTPALAIDAFNRAWTTKEAL